MIKRIVLAGVASLIFTASAYANQCPRDMAKIDAILPIKMSKLSAGNLAKVKSLRSQGDAEHKSGNHDASVKALAEAMKILGIN